ncbi:MAG: hypothetical protein H6810_05800 [Phycisphaeraceae bacterium]|nr:MAG: hypothetical protein H6810_05800 [Phycisphaeraceae bacterium]
MRTKKIVSALGLAAASLPAVGQVVLIDLGEGARPTSVARVQGQGLVRVSGFSPDPLDAGGARVLGVWSIENGAIGSTTICRPIAPWNEISVAGQLSDDGSLVAGASWTTGVGGEGTVWDAATGVGGGLGAAPGDADSEAACVRDDGVAGGGIWGSLTAAHDPVGGWSALLPPLDEPQVPAGAVEDAGPGVFVGSFRDSGGSLKACVWHDGSPNAERLDDPGSGDSDALSIDGGRVAGYSDDERACIWINGIHTPVPGVGGGPMIGFASVALPNGYVFGVDFWNFAAFVWRVGWPTSVLLDDWYTTITQGETMPYDAFWVTDGVLANGTMHLAVWGMDGFGGDAGLYLAVHGCGADLAPVYGVLDLQDVNAFVAGFLAHDAIADLDGNGIFDLQDINAFVNGFNDGCG